jgi:uncharacterized tellurite resistance protein B-like protein
MNNLNFQQKIAILRILLDIINADGRIDERETFYFNTIAKLLGVPANSLADVKDANSLLCLLELKGLSEEDKVEVAKLMGKQVIVDQDINVNEVAIFNLVCDTCGINIDLKDVVPSEEYAACSFS